ncbi:hypothetical protein TNIN_33761 [Trichonephila inaurata madagascariensis]|uniref:Uncharacterized protein n=1 Tax=Trichonephila inaurata madagascariensis TaxID=2747483 RepID=A0A8X6XAI5_9ARAC|nr:hypothetical protein TNIN_33761 [Trichonephila inaurata madagascariensis]
MVKTATTTNQKQIRNNAKIMWNFKKTNWKAFTEDMEHQVNTLLNDDAPQQAESDFILSLQKCAKKNIQRARGPTTNHFGTLILKRKDKLERKQEGKMKEW